MGVCAEPTGSQFINNGHNSDKGNDNDNGNGLGLE